MLHSVSYFINSISQNPQCQCFTSPTLCYFHIYKQFSLAYKFPLYVKQLTFGYTKLPHKKLLQFHENAKYFPISPPLRQPVFMPIKPGTTLCVVFARVSSVCSLNQKPARHECFESKVLCTKCSFKLTKLFSTLQVLSHLQFSQSLLIPRAKQIKENYLLEFPLVGTFKILVVSSAPIS